jgi:ubiquinone/menaquinone biosynthesis C-methylase UbiE
VDFAARAIGLARRKVGAAHLQAELLVRDATRLSGIDGPFDLALDIGCFHNVDDRAAYLRELKRILAPGGFWLMYGFLQTSGAGFGLSQTDLERICPPLSLVWRRDGTDRRARPSAWFLYQQKKT